MLLVREGEKIRLSSSIFQIDGKKVKTNQEHSQQPLIKALTENWLYIVLKIANDKHFTETGTYFVITIFGKR